MNMFKQLIVAGLALLSALVSPVEAQADRQPECLREQKFIDSYIYRIHDGGQPIGERIFAEHEITDPRMAGQGWEKWRVYEREREWSRATPGRVTEFYVEAHYMYNVRTRATAQFKLKNSLEMDALEK